MAKDLAKEYLIHCYLYYTLNNSIITDYEFDDLCYELEIGWNYMASPYKNLIYLLENGKIAGIKGTEVGDNMPMELIEEAKNRLRDHEALRELFPVKKLI